MKDQLIKRLRALKTEFEAGHKLNAEYEEKQHNLRETLLPISGAIMVLEEVIAEADSEENGEEPQPADKPVERQPLGELAASREET